MILPLILALGCTHHPAPPAAPAPSGLVDEQGQPLAPRPFPAPALAAGIPQGTAMRIRIAAAGEPTVVQRWTFTRCTAEAATIHSEVFDEAGGLLKDEGETTTPWSELEQHASFPLAATTMGEEAYDSPFGPLATWSYTVTVPGEDGVMLVKRYLFAKTLPGPPVLFTIERQGEEIFRMTMLERTSPATTGG